MVAAFKVAVESSSTNSVEPSTSKNVEPPTSVDLLNRPNAVKVDDLADIDSNEEDMDGFELSEERDQDIQNGILSWDHAQLVRNGCLAHLLQLAVKDSIKSCNLVSKLIKKVNDVVTFFTRAAMWKEALLLETGNLTLVKPIETRWNSAYMSIERILREDKKVF